MDLSYFNSRVRGLRGRLIRAQAYESYLKTSGAGEYLDSLRPTAYGPYLESAAAAVPGLNPAELISYALRQSLADALRSVWKEAPGEARPFIKAMLGAWEAYDLKAVVRGIVKNVKRSDILAVTVPAGEFDGAAIKTLVAAKDVRDVVRYLSTWGSPYAQALKDGLDMYGRTGSIAELELRVDLMAINAYREAFRGVSRDKRIMAEVLSFRADAVNLLTILKTAGEGYSKEGAASLFAEGGRAIDKKTFVDAASGANRDDAIKALAAAITGPEFRGIASMAELYDAAAVEEALDDALERRLRRLSVIEPLGISLCAAYIYEKVREMKNLRLIASAKLFGIPHESLAGYLFYR